MEVGKMINKYEIIEIYRKSANSTTGICMDRKLQKELFIKYIPFSQKYEIDHLLMMDTSRVPSIIDVIEDEEGIYYIMNYIKGVNIIEYIISQGISLYEFKSIIISLINSIESIHNKGIVHGDIKSDNIMIDKDYTTYIIDFGSSFREYDSNSYTLDYVAPERLTDLFLSDERSDIYSFGLLLEEMIRYYKKVSRFSIRRYFLFRRLKKIIKKATKLDPESRYQSISFIRGDLFSGI